MSWLPVRLAKKGTVVKLYASRSDVWVNGWEVIAISSSIRAADDVPAGARLYRDHRLRTGAA